MTSFFVVVCLLLLLFYWGGGGQGGPVKCATKADEYVPKSIGLVSTFTRHFCYSNRLMFSYTSHSLVKRLLSYAHGHGTQDVCAWLLLYLSLSQTSNVMLHAQLTPHNAPPPPSPRSLSLLSTPARCLLKRVHAPTRLLQLCKKSSLPFRDIHYPAKHCRYASNPSHVSTFHTNRAFSFNL